MTIKETKNIIFDILKDKGEIRHNDLEKELKSKARTSAKARKELIDCKAIEYDGEFYKLSYDARDKKDLKKYLKSLEKPKISIYQWIIIGVSIVSLLFGFYKHFQNNSLKTDYNTLEAELFSSKYAVDSLLRKSKILKSKYSDDKPKTKILESLNN